MVFSLNVSNVLIMSIVIIITATFFHAEIWDILPVMFGNQYNALETFVCSGYIK